MLSSQIVEKTNLSGKLEEFRTALNEEIKSARANGIGNAISLKSGRRIAKIGKSFQYIFQLLNVITLPADLPAEIHTPNNKPIEVSIISIDGLAIILSCRNDLGEFVASAQLVSDLTFLLRKLIERIEELSTKENLTGDRILSNEGVTEYAHHLLQEFDTELNNSQLEAVKSSISRNLTFIWGPSGTGKTMTIGSIGLTLQSQNRSLLLVSHTNTAVDQALYKIAKRADKKTLEEGKIIRIGVPKDPKIADEFPDLLIDNQVTRKSKELSKLLNSLQTELGYCNEEIQRLINDIDLYDWYLVARSDLDEMQKQNNHYQELSVALIKSNQILNKMKEKENYWSEARINAILVNEKKTQLDGLDS